MVEYGEELALEFRRYVLTLEGEKRSAALVVLSDLLDFFGLPSTVLSERMPVAINDRAELNPAGKNP